MRYPFLAPLVALAILLCCSTSCIDKYADEQLNLAEEIMETHPDSAYSILSQIDKSRLKGKPKQARYALLMSAAMDKNLIDTTTFDVLQPAIDYFLKRGTPNEKLKTYYYRGRIFQNTGDRDNALASFVRGSDISDQCSDSMAIARNFVAMGYLYHDLYDNESSTNNYLKAANIYKSLSRKDLEFSCLLGALNGYILLEDENNTARLLKRCDNFNDLNLHQQQQLQDYKLTNAVAFGKPKDIRNFLDSLNFDKISDINSVLDLALAYHKIDDNNSANRMLELVEQSNVCYDTLRYLAISVSVLERLGNYKDALSAYTKYSNLNDSVNQQKFDQKSKQIEERHQLELNAEKEAKAKSRIIWGCFGGAIMLTLVIMLLLILVRKNIIQKELAIQKAKTKDLENSNLKSEREKLDSDKKRLMIVNQNLHLEMDKKALEAENLAHRVEVLEDERDNLKNLMVTKNDLPSEVQSAIKERIEMLNSLLAGYITNNNKYEKPYECWVREITTDSEHFMDSNRLAFQASHPNFLNYFKVHGLDTSEINYVCLYAIGLKGTEIGKYMKKPGHINISSNIRKKLGIDKHETNIGIYVRKLLKSL